MLCENILYDALHSSICSIPICYTPLSIMILSCKCRRNPLNRGAESVVYYNMKSSLDFGGDSFAEKLNLLKTVTPTTLPQLREGLRPAA